MREVVDVSTGELLTPADSLMVSVSPFKIEGPGCSVSTQPTAEEADVFGQQIFYVRKNLPWIIGDYCNIVEHYLDENIYLQLLNIGDIDFRTLQNYKSVAYRVPFSRRRENLSWSHHEAIASLSEGEQEYWLRYSEENHVSVRDLRLMVRDVKPLPSPVQREQEGDQSSKGRWLDERTLEQVSFILGQVRDIMAMPHLDRESAQTLIDKIANILVGDYDDEDFV